MKENIASHGSPNVVLFMADSYVPQFMGIHGDEAGCTPNIDRLASDGVVFENAYCNSPLCAPSRASLLTGRFASEIGCFDNANEFASEWPTMGHVFRRAGYETVIIGKMHFFGYDQFHGFDKRIALDTDYTQGYDPAYYALAYDWDQPSGGNPLGGSWMAQSYVNSESWDNYTRHFDWDERIHEEAISYLSEKGDSTRPFFCCISYHQPHNPFWISEHIKKQFRNRKLAIPDMRLETRTHYNIMDRWLNDFHFVPQHLMQISENDNLQWLYETFYGMMYDVDMRIGELLHLMHNNGLAENTVVVFTSDHGDMLGYRGMIQKRCFYERSAKVPLVFAFRNRWQEGLRVSNPVSLIDILPTFAELAAIEPPEGLPGKSILSAMMRGEEPAERIVFSEYHGEGVHAPCFMALKGRFKYVYVHGYEECLYNLQEDPPEFFNVIDDRRYSAIQQELKSALLAQFDPGQIAVRAQQSQKNRSFIYRSERGNQQSR